MWTTKPQIVNRKCLHAGCEVRLEYGTRVLYFIKRARAMCAACGEQYKQLFT